ncbi:uncharacterized protein LOC125224033 [Salvia hispanica]|uniref:uncharacterized protein LOC125224033 n=1 Tax=Salvia hispanica TaxID=49212 RepID=UPI0020090D68|nr:uncharacterized protein LOC125224033 [Salvia hispanica]
MEECNEIPTKFSSVSSSENRDSIGSLNGGEDDEFYDKIEAPKFVDFTVPDHYSPDDHYWFCLRVGCDQKHEEEMDSEAIYNNFVLRVMAARSPNVRLRKALDRNASRTPTKCPLSAPPKSSKPRLSRMAVISSMSKKMDEGKKKVVRPLLKPGSTPVTKTKPVAAKYLTTPRNKKSISDQSSFRSVQHPKRINVEVPKSRMVAKALVFRSPKKAIKVKTSFELRTPVSKLCQGMNKLEISSQRRKPLQTCKGQEDKLGRSVRTKTKGQLSQKQECEKFLGRDETHSLKKEESCAIGKQLDTKVSEESGLQESSHEEAHSTVPPATQCLDSASPDYSKGEVAKAEECNGNENITSESCVDHHGNNSSEGERNGLDFEDGDDKENVAASDENRMPSNILKQNERKIFGVHQKCDQVRKKVTQAHDILKEGLSGPVMKLKKPKATNPKPFRLRTDERGVLKEATLDRRVGVDSPASQCENTNVSTPGGKLQKKNASDIQKGSPAVVSKTPKRQERLKSAAPMTPESNKPKEQKVKSSAMQRLEKFRKLTSSSVPKRVRPQGVESKKQELVSLLIPGQKLDVIHETSPQVSEPQSTGKAGATVRRNGWR